jgi:hypothetical protein
MDGWRAAAKAYRSVYGDRGLYHHQKIDVAIQAAVSAGAAEARLNGDLLQRLYSLYAVEQEAHARHDRLRSEFGVVSGRTRTNVAARKGHGDCLRDAA